MLNLSRTLALRGAVALLASTPLLAAAVGVPEEVPEPGTWALVGVALVAAIALSRKKRK